MTQIRSHQRALILTLGALLGLTTFVNQPHALTSSMNTLAKELSTLRVKVDTLSGEIAQEKTKTQTTLRSLSMQHAELEAQIQRETLRIKQLQAQKQTVLQDVQRASKAKAKIKPTTLGSIHSVRAQISASLPFKQPERLRELDAIEKQLKDNLIRPEKASARLWQFVEDELRLTRESGLYQHIISLGQEEILCDVIRLGMVALYFRTQDGRLGLVARHGDTWQATTYSDPKAIAQVQVLFDSFKKNIRTGFFRLPNPTPLEAK